ncbi:MAG: Methylthioribose-phosphate isomerase [Firmicutes bacterium]|nr:Methylthioribose-phosphate isomerase [Bacillota bacterium]
MQSILWENGCLMLLNQTLLPERTEYITCRDYRRVAEAIRRLEVRGAPAIGAAAAFGMVLGARELSVESLDFWDKFAVIADELKQTRPTAVNLFWAVDRMFTAAKRYYQKESNTIHLISLLEAEALAIFEEDKEVNKRISAHGAALFNKKISILTHCNAGALATVAWGTALGVIRQAFSQGKIQRVFADETRPLLQGARLTAWELLQEGIPTTLITDSMAGWVMKKRMVDAVIVGADRITLSGDVANKIGTYSVAVLAKEHNLPFYVAAPLSTFDFSLEKGEDIQIEERAASEVTGFGGTTTAPGGVEVFNPAFDVTPAALVTAIITEEGIVTPPYIDNIRKLKELKGGK